jgi:hypothetical protein
MIDKGNRFSQHVGLFCFHTPDDIGSPFFVSLINRRFPCFSFTQKCDDNNIALISPSTPQNIVAVGLIFSARQITSTSPPRFISVCYGSGTGDFTLPSDRGAEWNGPEVTAARCAVNIRWWLSRLLLHRVRGLEAMASILSSGL